MISAFVFPGQGSQFIGMGKDLFENFSSARDVFKEIDDILGIKLSSVTFKGPEDSLNLTSNTQPSLMSVSMALISVLEKEFNFSIRENCSFSAGHSLGEYTSLCAMKSLKLSDTANLLKIRGSSMEKAMSKGEGGMAALIGTDTEKVKNLVKSLFGDNGLCEVANDNGAGQVVVSGKMSAIDKIVSEYKDYDIKKAVKLSVSGPFHSKFMLPAAKIMEEALSEVDMQMPIVPVLSNVTALEANSVEDIKLNLVNQIVSMVRWREIIENLKNKKITRLVEIGPGKVLCNIARRIYKDLEVISIQNIKDIESFVKLY